MPSKSSKPSPKSFPAGRSAKAGAAKAAPAQPRSAKSRPVNSRPAKGRPAKAGKRAPPPRDPKAEGRAAARAIADLGQLERRTDAGVADVQRTRSKDTRLEFHGDRSKKSGLGKAAKDPDAFEAFFQAEIDTELESEATIYNDRFARWRCQCCDTVIPVPRRTTVYHGDYVLEHDDLVGLLVNGEKFVPQAQSSPDRIEVVQPGRLRDPFTGKLLKVHPVKAR